MTSSTRGRLFVVGLLIAGALATALTATGGTRADAQEQADPLAVYAQVLSDAALDDLDMTYALSWTATGVQENGLATLAAENMARAQFIAEAEAAQQREAFAAFLRSRAGGGGGGSRCGGDFECFKQCTLDIESDGNYGAVSPGGTYRGAWQFDQTTWDSNSAASGRYDLVGMDPAQASPEDQDAMAHDLYRRRGNQPWGGRC